MRAFKAYVSHQKYEDSHTQMYFFSHQNRAKRFTQLGTAWEWGRRAETEQPLAGVNWTSFYA